MVLAWSYLPFVWLVVSLLIHEKWSNAYLNRAFSRKVHRNAYLQPVNAQSKSSASYKQPSTIRNVIESQKPRWLQPGMAVEYTNTKGSKRFAIIQRIINKHNVEVLVETPTNTCFMIAMYRIVNSFPGNYTTKDLAWHRLATTTAQYEEKLKTLWKDALDPSSELSKSQEKLSLEFITRYLSDIDHGQVSPFRLDGIERILSSSSSYGSQLFKKLDNIYTPLPAGEVERRQSESQAVKAFQQRWVKLLTEAGKRHPSTSSILLDDDSSSSPSALNGLYNEIPIRASEHCLQQYAQGLIQFFIARHLPTTPSTATRQPAYNKEKVALGLEFLEILKLAPTAKNAKRVLEVMGIWSPYENTDKIILGLDKDFPQEVLEEANVLMWNQDSMIDPDERIRVNLQHLSSSTYAIDSEYAQEIDDAISIEYLDNGTEKLWIHIADVSRWIRPGCALSLEAERRMSSVYLPDEKISMFPERLSSELLSLGAANKPFSHALSVGVVLNNTGGILSCEICPSTIKVNRRLTYPQIDDILETIELAKEQYGRMLTAQLQPGDSGGNTSSYYLRNTTDVVEMLACMKYSSFPSSPSANSKHAQLLKKNILLARYHPQTIRDLIRLNQWSKIRHRYRREQGALDDYLRCKTELMLYVRQQQQAVDTGEVSSLSSTSSAASSSSSRGGAGAAGAAGGRWQVTGSLTWSNATGISTVSEYMILMSQAVGQLAIDQNISVVFKTQTFNSPHAPIAADDLLLREHESPFLRTLRLLSKMKPANDSKIPGPHVTSGSVAYVQCTSPIRRYHDLYNHYRLKHAMHAASLRDQWIENARELTEINKLENMASADERMQRLNIIRQASRTRFAFWLKIYLSRLAIARPKQVLTCIVSPKSRPPPRFSAVITTTVAPPINAMASSSNNGEEAVMNSSGSSVSLEEEISSSTTTTTATVGGGEDEQVQVVSMLAASSLSSSATITSKQQQEQEQGEYLVHVLELGSDDVYNLWSNHSLQPGDMLECHLYKLLLSPGATAAEKASPYLLLDVTIDRPDLPPHLQRKVIW